MNTDRNPRTFLLNVNDVTQLTQITAQICLLFNVAKNKENRGE